MANKINLEYQSTMSKIDIIFRNLKETGINISDFENEVKNINKEVEDELDLLDSTGYSQANNFNRIYELGTEKAKKLLDTLEKYNKYYQLVDKCYFVQGSQDIPEFSKEELASVADNIIELLTVIKNYNIVLENDNNMIKNLYTAIYEIIKIEFSYNGTSKLLDYCKQSDIDSSILSKLIMDEVDDLNNGDYDVSKINELLKKYRLEDNCYSFLDDKLIQLISLTKNKDKYLDELSSILNLAKIQINENKDTFDSLARKMENEKDRLNERVSRNKEENGDSLKTILKTLIPIVMCGGVAAGTYLGVSNLFWGTHYKVTTETYSSSTEKTISEEEYQDQLIYANRTPVKDFVTIEKTTPWVKVIPSDSGEVYFERTVESTYIQDVVYDDLSEYLDLDLESSDIKYDYSENVERKSTLSSDDMYNENTYEVVKIHQDLSDKKLGKSDNKLENFGIIFTSAVLSFIALALADMILLLISSNTWEEYELIECLSELFDELGSLEFNGYDTREQINNIKNISQKLKNIVDSNAKIKQELNSALEKQKYKILLEERASDMSLIDRYIGEMENVAKMSLKKK